MGSELDIDIILVNSSIAASPSLAGEDGLLDILQHLLSNTRVHILEGFVDVVDCEMFAERARAYEMLDEEGKDTRCEAVHQERHDLSTSEDRGCTGTDTCGLFLA